jgi:oligoribonuclease (3'-5' exoribonuclease)
MDRENNIRQLIAEELGITVEHTHILEEVAVINDVALSVIARDVTLNLLQKGGVNAINWCEFMSDTAQRHAQSGPMPRINDETYATFEAAVLSMLNLLRMGMTTNGNPAPPAPPALLLPLELSTT